METTPTAVTVRRSEERGLADHGWLRSRHSFSFSDYHDPRHMGFRSLRVINDDVVAAGRGFPEHPHRDMEIFSFVLEGALAHRDSLGNARVLAPGQVQLMGAGTGVRHSESNPSTTKATHFLQVWIRPNAVGLPPSYTEWHPAPGMEGARKVLIISPDGREGSAVIRQDAFVYRIRLEPGDSASHVLAESRGAWLQVARGVLDFQGVRLATGDGASVEEPGELVFQAVEPTEALLFDLA
jgi:redox-sensitive bicupin YhaK (pirin superfamily)